MQKIHYPNLNFLRFLAASIVIVHHVEHLKFMHGYDNYWNYGPVKLIGKLGVDLFFVLSGFLITSLLLIEKQLFVKISIKKFIIRRLLRIWPLYFIVFFIGFFIAPHIHFLDLGKPFVPVQDHFKLNALFYVLFLPHVQLYLIGPIAYCSQAWSIGIEEYFYLFWPFIVNKFTLRKTLYVIAGLITCYFMVCLLSNNLTSTVLSGNWVFFRLNNLINGELKFDCLLIGAAFGIWQSKLREGAFITTHLFQVIVYLTELFLVYSGLTLNGFYWEIHAILYGFIILNLVNSSTSIINMEFKIFDYLGKISYGLYMYHYLIINIIIGFFYKYNCSYLLYPAVFGSVILVASLSYQYVEKYFMNKKVAYSNILTG